MNLTLVPAYLGNAQHGEDFYIGVPPADFLELASIAVAGNVSSVSSVGDITINTGSIRLRRPGALGGADPTPSTTIDTGAIHLSNATPPPVVLPTLGEETATNPSSLYTNRPNASGTTLATDPNARALHIALAVALGGVALLILTAPKKRR